MLVTYQKTIYTALREVSDALAAHDRTRDQYSEEEKLVAALSNSVRLSTLRYRGGLDSYLQVLDAERNLFAGQLTLAQLRLAGTAIGGRSSIVRSAAAGSNRKRCFCYPDPSTHASRARRHRAGGPHTPADQPAPDAVPVSAVHHRVSGSHQRQLRRPGHDTRARILRPASSASAPAFSSSATCCWKCRDRCWSKCGARANGSPGSCSRGASWRR